MGRKVFISFLGNTQYRPSTYVEEPGTPKKNFVQEVILDSLFKDWGQNDRIYIICTKGENGSFAQNWEGNRSGTSLKTILQEKNYFPIVKTINLEEQSANDMWEVFDKVYSLITSQEDELYLDVTNAFRSFTVFATTLLQYAQFMTGAQVNEIYYSLFDPQTQSSRIQKLSSIVELQQCIEVASGVMKYGRFNKLAEVLKQKGLIEASNALTTIDGQFGANRGGEIKEGKSFKQLSEQRRAINRTSLSSPVKNVLNHAIDGLKDFKGQSCLENQLAAARWAFEMGMLPQAYTFGKEYINAKVTELIGESYNPYRDIKELEKRDKRKKYLEYLNAILALKPTDVYNKLFKDDLKTYEENTLAILELDLVKKLRDYYPDLNKYRNQICHAKNGANYKQLDDFFGEIFEKCIEILENKDSSGTPDISQSHNIFINISNHPSQKWSSEQVQAASTYGIIYDFAFPLIDESANEEQIAFEADILLNKISQIAPSPEQTTVHIMGEMTFTYAMVNLLKAAGYTCVASTSKRIVEELPDGSKNVKFEFCQFREY